MDIIVVFNNTIPANTFYSYAADWCSSANNHVTYCAGYFNVQVPFDNSVVVALDRRLTLRGCAKIEIQALGVVICKSSENTQLQIPYSEIKLITIAG